MSVSGIVNKAVRIHVEKKKAIKKWSGLVSRKRKIACDGCRDAHCCYQMVVAHMFEGVLLANHLMEKGQLNTLEEISEHGRDQGEMLMRAGYGGSLIGSIDPIKRTAEEWFDRHIPCPFLKDNLCQIYTLRPLSCAAYLVVDDGSDPGPPQICGPPTKQTVPTADPQGLVEYFTLEDSAFIAEITNSPDRMLVTPVPFGTAVFYGALILTQGPEHLSQHAKVITRSHDGLVETKGEE